MKQSTYNYRQVDDLISRYLNFDGGEAINTKEGWGSGDWICTAPGKKTAIIKEVISSCFDARHTIRLYNIPPAKYINLINQIQLKN